ncbi:glycosyltransferase family 4 protein [Propionivibrio sp.]|uniref:glycosyltransferase family 4 protein n=1 Tax=Propionivibrio sp. TaxID=2212460 RepID=UPI0025FF9F8F|nr:glycosyltransferase family 4 protein [Propionivibrio sp.]MBK8743855.1 glycosyltransferase family 4 protein [Propionivibrio sp.]
MKICQLCAVDFTLKNFLLPLIDGMQARGWQVSSVCSAGSFVDALRIQGYRIETIEIARSMNPLAALRSLYALIRLFRRERYDVLHVHTPVAALIGRLAAWLTGIPLVIYTAHGFYFHDDMPVRKYKLFVAIERLAGHMTDIIFTQSAEDAHTAVAERIISAERVQAIGNGVDASRFDPRRVSTRQLARDALGIPADAFVVGLIGRQVREKGVADFLLAAQQLAGTYPQIWFLLVGERLVSDHAAGVDIEFSMAQAVLGVRLAAPGLRADIPEMLSAIDLFCLPSWREGMPRTIIEAMMMAKPVLATDIRGSREEVVHEETGLLVPVRSPELLAAAIERFADNPAWGLMLGAAGRERALRLYDEKYVVAMQLERIGSEASLRGIR